MLWPSSVSVLERNPPPGPPLVGPKASKETIVLNFFVDGVNFKFHKGFYTLVEAMKAAIAATLAEDSGIPNCAQIWDLEAHKAVAVIRDGEVFLPQDQSGA